MTETDRHAPRAGTRPALGDNARSLLRRRLALAGIVLLGFVLRAWGLTWGLYDSNVSRRPHPDEWSVYWLFHWFTAHRNLDPCPTSHSACFFDWGMTYPYAAYAVRLLMTPFTELVPSGTFGPRADMEFVWAVIAGRTTALILSTLTILVVYRLAVEAFDPGTGLVAALVTALSTLLQQLAHFATPDSLTVFLVSCTLLLVVRAQAHPTAGRFVAAGALVGVSTGSEYHMVLLAVPLAAAWTLSKRSSPISSLLAGLAAAAVMCLLIGAYALVHLPDFIAATEHTLRIRTVDSAAQYGDRWSAFGPAWLYVVRYPLGYGVGFALTVWMLAGTGWALLRRSRVDWVLLSWLVIYFILVSVSPAKFMRYSAPLLPVLSVFAGRLTFDLARIFHRSGRVVVASLVTAAVAFSMLYDGAYAGLFTATDPRLSAAQWVDARASALSQIDFDQLPNGLINLPYFFTAEGFQPCFSEFRPARLSNAARYVVTDDYDLEEHPRIQQGRVNAFDRTLQSDPDIRLVLRVHHVPTFLGTSFSIDGSPHDWRYPSHVIAVYEKRPATPGTSAPTCFTSLAAAHSALYRPAAGS